MTPYEQAAKELFTPEQVREKLIAALNEVLILRGDVVLVPRRLLGDVRARIAADAKPWMSVVEGLLDRAREIDGLRLIDVPQLTKALREASAEFRRLRASQSADLDTLRAELERVKQENARLTATNTRLNRRCQSAEAAADTKSEDWNARAAGRQLRNHYYVRAKEAEAERDQLKAEVQRLQEPT